MKRKFTAFLLTVFVVLSTVLLSSCGSNTSKNPTRPDYIPTSDTSEYDLDSDTYRVIAETDNVRFEYNDLTTDIRLTNKKSGFSWSTESTDNYGEVHRGEIFSLKYYTVQGATVEVNTADGSVSKGQFKATDIENGISVQYGIGEVGFTIDFPLALSVERRDHFYEMMTEDQKYTFDSYYVLYDFSDEKWDDREVYSEAQLSEIKNNHPLAANGTPWYYMDSSLDENTMNELHQLFVNELGYTTEDFESDSKGVSVAEVDRPEFNVLVNYTLDGDDLRVEIPEEQIYYPENYTVDSLQLHPRLLEYGYNTSGYYLLPDGSGSLLNFNNGKDELRNDAIYVQMYGVDDSRGIEEKTAYVNQAIFPVYGCTIRSQTAINPDADTSTMKDVNAITELANDKDASKYNGLFAVIESGESFAGIEAHSGSPSNDTMNKAYTEFRINESEKMASFSSSDTNTGDTYSRYQFQRYLGNLTVVYHLLSGDDATYSGMAQYYKSKLFGDEKTEKQDYYSTVETLGVINGYAYFMGIEYDKKIAMSTFDQTAEIAKDLQSNGFKNLNIRLTGWCNGGYEHGFLNKIKVAKELGGESDFKTLAETLSDSKIGLYPDVDYQYVYSSEKSATRSKAAETLSGRISTLDDIYSIVTFKRIFYRRKWALTVAEMEKNLNGFIDSYQSYGINNISMRSIGSQITANYRESDFCERQETLENLVKQVAAVKEKGYSIMGSVGDAPFIKYLDVINDMPIVSAGYDKSDYSVPFTAMVLSGHVNYTAKAVNLSNNDKLDLLEMIEAGSGAYYTLSYDKYENIAYSDYSQFYSTQYSDIKDSVLSTYNYLSEALQSVYGLSIVKHEILADGVNRVTYENGVSIIVNYTDKYYSADGVSCSAQDYTVVKGA